MNSRKFNARIMVGKGSKFAYVFKVALNQFLFSLQVLRYLSRAKSAPLEVGAYRCSSRIGKARAKLGNRIKHCQKTNHVTKTVRTVAKLMIEALFRICIIEGHFFIDSFSPNPVIVDLGAGKGEFSAGISRRIQGCRIILIEPDPCLVQELTLQFGNRKGFEVFNAAVGNEKTSKGKFYLNRDWRGNSLMRPLVRNENYQGEIKVEVVALNDIFSLFNLRKIDLLKVDIEGGELDIFAKFSKHDFERIFQISVEFHDFVDPSLRLRTKTCVEALKEFGYALVSRGTSFVYGTPYYNCIFYDKRRLRWNTLVKVLNIPKQISNLARAL